MQEFGEKYKQEQEAFINALHKLLNTHEFDYKIVEEAEKICGFKSKYSLILFPLGLKEIVDNFVLSCDELMLNKLSKIIPPEKIREKIELSVNLRIKSFEPYIHAKIGAYMSNPLHAPYCIKYTWRTADAIWRFWNDESVDFNYYSKRSILSGVYLSSILFYIKDNSDNYNATDLFIKNAIKAVIKIGAFKKNTVNKLRNFWI